ncbi:hypothetical protein [Bacillus sp. FJAT-45037]|uniref:hypothetical protein n=1 Tax=Bacillus sp. FJAT-45037 TaxID=2011007 RepID=UPI0012FD1CF0|nr:hypothetical protein [Bacillus sp. FJAT-45037]
MRKVEVKLELELFSMQVNEKESLRDYAHELAMKRLTKKQEEISSTLESLSKK